MSAKYEIVLDTRWQEAMDFNRWYYELFFSASNVNISYEEMPLNKAFQECKRAHLKKGIAFGDLTFFKFNGKLIALDTWSHCKYLEPMHQRGFFKNLEVDLYIKLDEAAQLRSWLGYKTVNWVMFPGGRKFTEAFKWENKQHQYLTMFTTGPHSMRTMHRVHWYDYCRTNPSIFAARRVEEAQFKEVLSNCKFGLSIVQNAYKNTREYEFISCNMPFVLNYCPRYDFPFEPNKHFVYLTKPEELATLATLDPTPFAQASKDIWDNYYQPDAAVRYLDFLLNK